MEGVTLLVTVVCRCCCRNWLATCDAKETTQPPFQPTARQGLIKEDFASRSLAVDLHIYMQYILVRPHPPESDKNKRIRARQRRAIPSLAHAIVHLPFVVQAEASLRPCVLAPVAVA